MKKANIYKEEFFRAFWNPRWLIVILLSIAIFFIGNYRWPIPLKNPVNRMMMLLHYGYFDYLGPVLLAVPFADSFLTDSQQGFTRFIIQRTNYKHYLNAKTLATGLSGGLSLVLSNLIVFLLGLGKGIDFSDISFRAGYQGTMPWGPFSGLYGQNPCAYFGYLLLSVFIFGFVWSLLAMFFSTLSRNRYFTLAAPLIITQGLRVLIERSDIVPYQLNALFGLQPYAVYFERPTFSIQLLQYLAVFVLSLIGLFIFTRNKRETI